MLDRYYLCVSNVYLYYTDLPCMALMSIAPSPVSLCPAKIAVSARGSPALTSLLGLRLISPLNSGAILALPHGENGPAALPLTPAPLRAHSLRLEPHLCLLLWLLSWKIVFRPYSIELFQSPFTQHSMNSYRERAVLVCCLWFHGPQTVSRQDPFIIAPRSKGGFHYWRLSW